MCKRAMKKCSQPSSGPHDAPLLWVPFGVDGRYWSLLPDSYCSYPSMASGSAPALPTPTSPSARPVCLYNGVSVKL